MCVWVCPSQTSWHGRGGGSNIRQDVTQSTRQSGHSLTQYFCPSQDNGHAPAQTTSSMCKSRSKSSGQQMPGNGKLAHTNLNSGTTETRADRQTPPPPLSRDVSHQSPPLTCHHSLRSLCRKMTQLWSLREQTRGGGGAKGTYHHRAEQQSRAGVAPRRKFGVHESKMAAPQHNRPRTPYAPTGTKDDKHCSPHPNQATQGRQNEGPEAPHTLQLWRPFPPDIGQAEKT